MTARPHTILSLTLGLVAITAALPVTAQQTVAPDAGCVQQRDDYTCNWSSFLNAFDRAHTVAVQTSSMDRATAAQLRHLIADLGKTPANPGSPADLTFSLAPASEQAGVNLGPSDHELARLRVSAPTGTSGGTTLLWAETYRGQGDRPWPSQVHALLTQFQARFPTHQ